jgi:hypothetical protein
MITGLDDVGNAFCGILEWGRNDNPLASRTEVALGSGTHWCTGISNTANESLGNLALQALMGITDKDADGSTLTLVESSVLLTPSCLHSLAAGKRT